LGYLVRGHVVNIEGHNSIVRHTLDYCLRLAR
jgi:IS1 family transposase